MIKDFRFVHDLPGFFMVKNAQSECVAVSELAAKLAGWKDSYEGIGKTDYEVPSKVSEIADQFIETDKKVIKSAEKLISIDVVQYTNGWNVILAEKIPIKNDLGIVDKIFCSGINITSTSYCRPYLIFHQQDIKKFGNIIKQKTYILGFPNSILSLTKRQECCLFLLIRGKTTKEIAKVLHLSPRTIEDYVSILKTKMDCQYKSELVEKFIDSGFLCYFPKEIISL